jgi:hypothetical protein
LRVWKEVATKQNAILYYEYARTAVILGYYVQSKNLFQELQSNIGLGKSKRSKNSNPIESDEQGEDKSNEIKYAVYSGTISSIKDKSEGYISISSLQGFTDQISFRPLSAKFTPSKGDYVDFHIAFSFRGPYAIDLN